MAPFPSPAHRSLDAIPATAEIRKIYPRDFFPNPNTVRLPLGRTTYWLFGPEHGPKVVLVHGISSPSLVWAYIAPFLAENGFRVLAYDLFGRGYSEAPETVYNADLYTTQLALLLQHVQFASAHVIGMSMGGGIAGAFAATFPNLVTEKVVFIASAGQMEAASVPQVTPQSLAAMSNAVAEPVGLTPQLRKLQAECLPGYLQAIKSSIEHGPLRDMDNAFKAIAETPRLKCLIIHGTSDATVHFRFGEKIKSLLPAADFLPVEGADHDLIIADKYYEQVRVAILKFLQG
ncbi:alpha/beta-hydrolase [Gautieria morchelliformis]|nr:alpha/beta-hydrolase [Gautieria morchelliformis]